MNSEDIQALKRARLDRLNDRTRDCPRGHLSKKHIAGQQKIDRFCSNGFADAVAAGRILRSEDEVLAFASLPKELMGKADLAGVHDDATFKEFAAGNPRS